MSATRFYIEVSEKRSQLLQIVVGAIIIAIAIGLLINIIYDKLLRLLIIRLGLYETFLVILILITLLFIVIALFANIYLGRAFIVSIPMTLLINRVSGESLPITYEPANTANFILTSYVKEKEVSLFKEEVPDLRDNLLRDLIEVIIVDWFVKASSTYLTPDGRLVKPPISFPQTSKKYVTIKPLDILKTFGENSLSKLLLPPIKALPEASISIPKNFKVMGYRYEERGLVVELKVDDKVLFKRRISGAPGGSELIIKGTIFNPLKYFVVRTFINRTSHGDILFLELSGYTPISKSKNCIECKEKIFEGEELEKIRKWIEVNCTVVIAYKMKGWLFFHPRFLEVAGWVEAMANYADQYFNISKLWEILRKYKISGSK